MDLSPADDDGPVNSVLALAADLRAMHDAARLRPLGISATVTPGWAEETVKSIREARDER